MYLRNRVIGFFIYGKSWWLRISASSLLKRPSKLQKESRISSSKRNIRYWLNSKKFLRKISRQQINYYPKFGIDKNYNKNYRNKNIIQTISSYKSCFFKISCFSLYISLNKCSFSLRSNNNSLLIIFFSSILSYTKPLNLSCSC